MNKKQIMALENLLDERKHLAGLTQRPADVTYYNGIVQAIATIGYEVKLVDNKHKLLKM